LLYNRFFRQRAGPALKRLFFSTRFGAFPPEKIVRVNVTTFAKNFYWYGEGRGIAGNAFSLPVVMVYSLSEGRNNRVEFRKRYGVYRPSHRMIGLKAVRVALSLCLLLVAAGGCLVGGYALWSPGAFVTDGSHDMGTNGIWLQHGWLGDDGWFARNNKKSASFRDREKIRELALLLADHNMLYLFPHLCPCTPEGKIATVDDGQVRRFLKEMDGFYVLPWVGGLLGKHALLGSATWRNRFVTSIVELLTAYPYFAGIHLNIEPMPSGNRDFLTLLRELRRALPEGRMLSVAAYPPPTILHPFSQVHWDQEYFSRVAAEVDQLVIMMYDTSLKLEKLYVNLAALWTEEVLLWANTTDVLLGLPVYDDRHAGYHSPRVENLRTALQGIHGGLERLKKGVPPTYRGVAIYSEWEMDPGEWTYLREQFLRR
jgi:hypothetical protein